MKGTFTVSVDGSKTKKGYLLLVSTDDGLRENWYATPKSMDVLARANDQGTVGSLKDVPHKLRSA